ncbi:MAG TPA: sigma-70 family RNA polymerase sigma factor [Solirubrobacteraceae bacterium]
MNGERTVTEVTRPGASENHQNQIDTDVLFERLRRDDDSAARDELVERFLPLARKLAARYTNPYEPFDDLLQVASIGLLGAIDRFDPGRGVGFPSFAIPTILGELKRYFRSTGWSAHVPRRAQELALRVDKGSRQLSARSGRAPRVEEIAQYLEISTEDVLIGLDAGRAHYSVSLDAPSNNNTVDSEPESLGSSIGTEDDRIGLVETSTSLSAALKRLPFLEREALRLRLQEDLKQTEIAQRLGCSQMQVSRLLGRASMRVREMIEPKLTA